MGPPDGAAEVAELMIAAVAPAQGLPPHTTDGDDVIGLDTIVDAIAIRRLSLTWLAALATAE